MSWLAMVTRKFPLRRACGLAVEGDVAAVAVVAATLLETWVEATFEEPIGEGSAALAAGRALERAVAHFGTLPPVHVGLRPAELFHELKLAEPDRLPSATAGPEELAQLVPPSLGALDLVVEANPLRHADEPLLSVWATRREAIARLIAGLGDAARHLDHVVPLPLALAAALAAHRHPYPGGGVDVRVAVRPGSVTALALSGAALLAWQQQSYPAGEPPDEHVQTALRQVERRLRQVLGHASTAAPLVHLVAPGEPAEVLGPRLTQALGLPVEVIEGPAFGASGTAVGLALTGLETTPRLGSLTPPAAARPADRRPFRKIVRWREAGMLAALMAIGVLLAERQTAELESRQLILEGTVPAWARGKSEADLATMDRKLAAELDDVEEYLGRGDARWTHALAALADALPEDARLDRIELVPEAGPGVPRSSVNGPLGMTLEVEAPDEFAVVKALGEDARFHRSFPGLQLMRLKGPPGSHGSGRNESFEVRARAAAPPAAAGTPRPPS